MSVPDGTTGDAISPNRGVYMAIAAFTAVAWYNVIELNIQVFLTFKKHRGLYFWSLLISSYGCILHALGFLLKFLQLCKNDYVSVSIITIGWYCMVTGQSIVLYSRLHLVVREPKVLRGILAMIIVDAFCFHIPQTVLTFGTNSNSPLKFITVFNVIERLQMTAFCIQEFIISGVYVYATIKLLRPGYHGRTRKVMMQLIWINFMIIGMDIVLLVMEYSNNYEIEATLKPMVYSIKLKLEFAVLNQLMTLANSSINNAQNIHIQDHESQLSPTDDKEKSEGYWTRHTTFPKNIGKPAKQKPSIKTRRSRSASAISSHTVPSSFTVHKPGRVNWVPSLDRNCVVKTTHIENVSDPLFTNPAACFQSGKSHARYPPHDGLGGIYDSPPVSPTLTGTTLDHSSSHGYNRRAPPSHLDLSSQPVMPNGILRSSRPSVTDWAHGPDSECSPNSDDVQINPYDNPRFIPQRRPGSVRVGRGMAERSLGMEFMTSALKE